MFKEKRPKSTLFIECLHAVQWLYNVRDPFIVYAHLGLIKFI